MIAVKGSIQLSTGVATHRLRTVDLKEGGKEWEESSLLFSKMSKLLFGIPGECPGENNGVSPGTGEQGVQCDLSAWVAWFLVRWSCGPLSKPIRIYPVVGTLEQGRQGHKRRAVFLESP